MAIGGLTSLYKLTGKSEYLTEAQMLANAPWKKWTDLYNFSDPIFQTSARDLFNAAMHIQRM